MTNQDQIKALAELDGWKEIQINPPYPPDTDERLILGDEPVWSNGKVISYICDRRCKDYPTSYDAIIPLIRKQPDHSREEFLRQSQAIYKHNIGQICSDGWALLSLSCQDLCEALLRATGKWKE